MLRYPAASKPQTAGHKRPASVHGGRAYFGGPSLGPLPGSSRFRMMRAAAAAGRLSDDGETLLDSCCEPCSQPATVGIALLRVPQSPHFPAASACQLLCTAFGCRSARPRCRQFTPQQQALRTWLSTSKLVREPRLHPADAATLPLTRQGRGAGWSRTTCTWRRAARANAGSSARPPASPWCASSSVAYVLSRFLHRVRSAVARSLEKCPPRPDAPNI